MKLTTIHLVAVTVLIEVIGFSMIIPILPLMFTEPGSSIYVLNESASSTFQYLMLGFLFATYTVGQFFSNPIFGQISDKYGRRITLILAILGTSISNFIFAFGSFIALLPLLIGARLVDGVTGGAISIAQATAADLSDNDTRAKNFGIVGAAFGVGLMIGPLIGGVFSDPSIISWFGAPFAFVVSGTLSLINVFFIYKFLPETSPMDKSVELRFLRSVRNIGRAFSSRTTRSIYSLSFLYSFGFTMFTTFFGVFLVQNLGYSQSQIGYLFFYIGMLIIPSQIFLVPLADRMFSEVTNLVTSFSFLAFSLIAMAFIDSTIPLLFALALFALSNALGRTSITTIISKKTSENEQGKALGIDASVQSLGQAIPAVAAGVIAAALGASAPLIFAGLTFVLAIILVLSSKKTVHS